eukprot:316843_1
MKKRCEECKMSATNSYRLVSRKWFIKDLMDRKEQIETVEGDGVIGLYPKVFINQELFSYESCSNANSPINGEMWGYFVFEPNHNNNDSECDDKRQFQLRLNPYKLDWHKCQWI